MFRLLPILALSATPASAQFVENTLFPALEAAEPVLSFDGPVETSDGQRWSNLILLNEAENTGIRLDWLEESVSGPTTTLTFSPGAALFERGSDGTDTVVGVVNLTDTTWQIEQDDAGQSHDVTAPKITVEFVAPEEADAMLSVSGLDVAVDANIGDDYVLQSLATIAEVQFSVRDIDENDEAVTVTLREIETQQDSDIDADFFQRLQNADEEFANVDDVQTALDGRSKSQFEVGEIDISFSSDGDDVSAARFFTRNLVGEAGFDLGGEVLGATLAGSTDAILGTIDAPQANLSFEAAAYRTQLEFSTARDDLPEFVAAMEDGSPEALGAFDLRYEVEVGTTTLNGTFADDNGMSGAIDFTSNAGSEVIAIEDGRMFFEVLSDGFDGTMSLSMFGEQPFAASLAKLGLTFAMPVVPSPGETRDDMQFVMQALEAKVSEPVWSLFDPQSTIPRDPINIDIDLAAWGEVIAPFQENSEFNDVFRLDGAKINSFVLNGGGAEATATGETALDLSAGLPRGEGAFTVSLKGVADLVGKLSNLGIVPPEASLGLRGILGAFARPVGEDHYVSEIELLPDGQILTNGLPLPIGR